MGGRRNILGNSSSFGYLLLAPALIVIAAAIICSPGISDDSDAAADPFVIDDYYYVPTSDDTVSVSVINDIEVADISSTVYYGEVLYNVTEIADDAFENSPRTKTVKIPEGVYRIGDSAFAGCSRLTNVPLPSTLLMISSYAFKGCSSLENVTIPARTTSISSNAFDDCTSLRAITVESANTSYTSENGVLYNKSMTTLIRYPEGKTDAKYSMPNYVTSVYSNAMSNTKFTSVKLSTNLQRIGEFAFTRSSITSVEIPATVTAVLYGAFSYCYNLTDITVEEDNKNYTSIDGILYTVKTVETEIHPSGTTAQIEAYPCGRTTEVYEFADNVLSVQSYAFCGNRNLKEIIATSGYFVGTLEYAFKDCTSLTRVNIGDCVNLMQFKAYSRNYLNEGSFSGCKNLSSVYLPSSLSFLANNLFEGCESLSVVYIPTDVSTIYSNVFKGCKGLTSIYIPDSVWTIYDNAFDGFTFYEINGINTMTTSEIRTYAYTHDGGCTFIGTPDRMVMQIGTYHVMHYNENGGSITLADSMVKKASQFTFPEYEGTKEGYTFSGWEYKDKVYQPNEKVTAPYTNYTIYAVWTEVPVQSEEHEPDYLLGVLIAIGCVAMACAVGIIIYKYKKKKRLQFEDKDP